MGSPSSSTASRRQHSVAGQPVLLKLSPVVVSPGRLGASHRHARRLADRPRRACGRRCCGCLPESPGARLPRQTAVAPGRASSRPRITRVTAARLKLTRGQILAFRRARRSAGPAPAGRTRVAAPCGVGRASGQHAPCRAPAPSTRGWRARDPSAWEDPSLVQVWGPRYQVYVVAARDLARVHARPGSRMPGKTRESAPRTWPPAWTSSSAGLA